MNELVELQLRRPGDPPQIEAPSVWKPLVQQLLRILHDTTADGDLKETVDLRDRLAEYRDSFAGVMHPQEERQVAAACVRACEQYLRRIQQDRATREGELTELISILRDAATKLVGYSSDFHVQLLSSTDRFKLMTRLDDIRDLKKQLSAEVSSLEKVAEEKKQRDEKAIAKLSERVEVLQADLIKAEEQASIDPLTKIANRGSFDRALARMTEVARKTGAPLTLAMIDVDHFKAINDSHGHPVGDRVLLCTVDWMRSIIRRTDFVARYGGEEFAVIFQDANITQAETRMRQVLESIASRHYEYDLDGERKSVRFTVSCGVSQFIAIDTVQDLIHRADQALYDAKENGRNNVVSRKTSRLARLFGK